MTAQAWVAAPGPVRDFTRPMCSFSLRFPHIDSGASCRPGAREAPVRTVSIVSLSIFSRHIVPAPHRTYIASKDPQEMTMARYKNERLTSAAVKIGTAVGKADRRVREAASLAQSARKQLREELEELTKTADRLARDLKKTRKRLQRALR